MLKLIPRQSAGVLPVKEDIRILVIRLDRIGDLVLSTPVFRILRNSFPKASIDALVNENCSDIISNNPNINKVFTYNNFRNSLSIYRGKYDLVIDMLNGYELKTALLTRLLNAPFSIGFDVNNRGRFFTNPVAPSAVKKHFVNFLPDLLAPLKIEPHGDISTEVFPQNSKLATTSEFLGRSFKKEDNLLIAVHPGSYYISQRWPKYHFKTLMEDINAYLPNSRFLLLGSAPEMTLIESIYSALNDKTKKSTFKYAENDIGAAIALISLSKLFIGNNSGLLHIAAALKIPTVSFMGPTVPWLWHPWGPKETNIIIRKDLSCSPCNKGECKEHTCMESITPKEVFDTIKPILNQHFKVC